MRPFTILRGGAARAAERSARAADHPDALAALAAHGARVILCEQLRGPLPAIISLTPPCFEGRFEDEDEFFHQPPGGDQVLVDRWGGVRAWKDGAPVDPPPLDALDLARVGGFCSGPVLRLRWIGAPPASSTELLATIGSTDAAYAAWWEDWDARGRPT